MSSEIFFICGPNTDIHGSGECFYCKQGWSSRCDKNGLFGCDSLDGGQAEYVINPPPVSPH